MTPEITEEWLEAELALCAKATPEPWILRSGVSNGQGEIETRIDSDTGEWHSCQYFCFGWKEGSPVNRGERGKPGHEHKSDPTVIRGDGWHGSGDLVIEPDDAAFILASRTGYPALLQWALEALERERRLKEALEPLANLWHQRYRNTRADDGTIIYQGASGQEITVGMVWKAKALLEELKEVLP